VILTDQELVELTRRKRPGAQRRVLVALGVAFGQRPDGSIVVFRRDVEGPKAEPLKPEPQLRLPPPRLKVTR
jgi:hypothetical protein